MAERTRKGGRRRKRCRRFCTGVSVVRLRLGESQKKTISPSNQIGAIYVPTKWGGTLFVHATRKYGKRKGTLKTVRLFYKKDCKFKDKDDKFEHPPTVEEIKQGSNALGVWRKRYMYKVPEGKMGWFFVVVSGASKVAVWNAFVQRHSLSKSKDVWNSWYWPHALAKRPHLYDVKGQPDNIPDGCRGKWAAREDGPLIKFDRLTNQTSARKWEWETYGKKSPKEGDPCKYATWRRAYGGHCDATAWCGLEEKRPIGSKKVTFEGNEQTFTEQDRLGLAAERYWVGYEKNSNNIDEKDNDRFNLFRKNGQYLKVDWFHNKLRKRIAEDVGGIMVYVPNWNYGVFSYEATFVACGATGSNIKKITVSTRLTYIDWVQKLIPYPRKSNRKLKSKAPKLVCDTNRYQFVRYELEYDDDGTILPSVANTFIYVLKVPKKKRQYKKYVVKKKRGKKVLVTKVFYKNKKATISNSYLDKHKQLLEKIYR